MKLLAYKNQTVEYYGIPAMWFAGVFLEGYYAVGLTLCTKKNAKKINL